MTTRTPHVILTRFNVPTAGREADVRARSGWLERRFALFEHYCLPSIAGQSVRDFNWLIYFDSATPDAFRVRIERAQRCFPFTALFREELPLADVINDVRACLPSGAQRVLTTRLDNDDALARSFVARVQRAAMHASPGSVLNFPDGYAWRNGWVYAARDESGPFASALEDVAALQTIWARPHALLHELFNLVQLNEGAAWLQVIHGDNVTNRVKGRQRPASALGDRFCLGMAVQAQSPGALEIAMENAVRYPLRVAREAAVKLAKPFLKVVR